MRTRPSPLFAGLLALALLLPLGAAADDDNPLGPQGLSEADAGRIGYLMESWFENLHFGNMEEWQKVWATDGVLAPPGEKRILGIKAISAYMEKIAQNTMQFELSSNTIVGRDDLAVVANTIVWDVPGLNVVATERYNQMIILRKDEAGDWKVQSMLFNVPNPAQE